MNGKKAQKDFDCYISETLGGIKSEIVNLKDDIKELKNAIEPMKIRTYMTAGVVTVIVSALFIIGQIVVKYLIGN